MGGKSDPNLYIQLEFLVIGGGFSCLFLFNYKTIKMGAVNFRCLLLTAPGEQTCTLTAWANPGSSLCSFTGKGAVTVFTVTMWPSLWEGTQSSAPRGRKSGGLRLRGCSPRSAAYWPCELKEIVSVYIETILLTKELGHYLQGVFLALDSAISALHM